MRYAGRNLLSMAAQVSAGGGVSTRPMGVSPGETTMWSDVPARAADSSTSVQERTSRALSGDVAAQRDELGQGGPQPVPGSGGDDGVDAPGDEFPGGGETDTGGAADDEGAPGSVVTHR
jgi:hypothetical protein